MENYGSQIKKDATLVAALSTESKNAALSRIADKLIAHKEEIIAANQLDVDQAKKENLPDPIIKRLILDERKIDGIVTGIESLIALPDPVGETLLSTELDEGLELYRVSCPIGVIGVIFESRPDALVQISTLCLKSGNAAIIKGGSEARNTNKILSDLIRTAACEVDSVPKNWLVQLETRAEINEILQMDDYIDLLIPRGSNEFIRYIMEHTKIPVMGHADGICHCYIDKDADLELAVGVVVDSKTQYVSVCNAAETLLVHEAAAASVLPAMKQVLEQKGVRLKGCEKTCAIIEIDPADEEDWKTEYLDYILSIKVVSGLGEAISHINHYGSHHTDSIISKNKEAAHQFMLLVDSANVFHNCSTRFSDGFRYGFGAEVGISTGKLHARGPVGLDGLVTYKYLLFGQGQIVRDYEEKRKHFTHKKNNKNVLM